MSTTASHLGRTPQNMLLGALAAPEGEWAGRNFKPVFMPLRDVLYEPGGPVNHIFFPTTSVLSVSCVMTDGRADALTLIGREGFAGVEDFLGGGSATCRAVVLSEGWGYRIRRELLRQTCEQDGTMRSVLLRYAQSYITQVSQTISCNRHHSIVQQLCRWLLMFLDRQASNELPLTHEHIAELLGVRRESVTEAAGKLQIAGCIRYHRGHISVDNRLGLEARSCECYRIAKRETDRPLEISRSAKVTATRAVADRVRSGRSEPSTHHAASNFA
ncbi:MAG: Crp/Fnr family transcriptional regulator [Steroidobacteraceae bacterium]